MLDFWSKQLSFKKGREEEEEERKHTVITQNVSFHFSLQARIQENIYTYIQKSSTFHIPHLSISSTTLLISQPSNKTAITPIPPPPPFKTPTFKFFSQATSTHVLNVEDKLRCRMSNAFGQLIKVREGTRRRGQDRRGRGLSIWFASPGPRPQ